MLVHSVDVQPLSLYRMLAWLAQDLSYASMYKSMQQHAVVRCHIVCSLKFIHLRSNVGTPTILTNQRLGFRLIHNNRYIACSNVHAIVLTFACSLVRLSSYNVRFTCTHKCGCCSI